MPDWAPMSDHMEPILKQPEFEHWLTQHRGLKVKSAKDVATGEYSAAKEFTSTGSNRALPCRRCRHTLLSPPR